jgi:cell division protein FtsL
MAVSLVSRQTMRNNQPRDKAMRITTTTVEGTFYATAIIALLMMMTIFVVAF